MPQGLPSPLPCRSRGLSRAQWFARAGFARLVPLPVLAVGLAAASLAGCGAGGGTDGALVWNNPKAVDCESVILRQSRYLEAASRLGFDRVPALDAKTGLQTGLQAPVYGNWCGPTSPTATAADPPPVDELDAACRAHALCYRERGWGHCVCDRKLVETIDRLRDDDRDSYRCEADGAEVTVVNYHYRAIASFFRDSPCSVGCKPTSKGREMCGIR